jgi:hypothetical protein
MNNDPFGQRTHNNASGLFKSHANKTETTILLEKEKLRKMTASSHMGLGMYSLLQSGSQMIIAFVD